MDYFLNIKLYIWDSNIKVEFEFQYAKISFYFCIGL